MDEKTCCVCWMDKPLADYHSNGRGKKKPYCKTCKPVYEGIRSGLLDASLFQGLDFDYRTLRPNRHGYILMLVAPGGYREISLERATRMVRQAGAFVVGVNAIEQIGGSKESMWRHVKKRDGHRCYYCGGEGNTVDHIRSLAGGGVNSLLNLVCACLTCNSRKADGSKDRFLRTGALKPQQTRKCGGCKKWVPSRSMHNASQLCYRCKPHQKAVDLGFTSYQDAPLLTGPDCLDRTVYEVVGANGEIMKPLPAEKVEPLLEKGLAKWEETTSRLHLLYTPKQLKQLHPHPIDGIDLSSMSKSLVSQRGKRRLPYPPEGPLKGRKGRFIKDLTKVEADQLLRYDVARREGEGYRLTSHFSDKCSTLPYPVLRIIGEWALAFSQETVRLDAGNGRPAIELPRRIAHLLWEKDLIAFEENDLFKLKDDDAYAYILTDDVQATDWNGPLFMPVRSKTAKNMVIRGEAWVTGHNSIYINAYDDSGFVRLYDQHGERIGPITHQDRDVLESLNILKRHRGGYKLVSSVLALMKQKRHFPLPERVGSLLRYDPIISTPSVAIRTEGGGANLSVSADWALFLLRSGEIAPDEEGRLFTTRPLCPSLFLRESKVKCVKPPKKSGETIARMLAIQKVFERKAVIVGMNKIMEVAPVAPKPTPVHELVSTK